MRKTLNILLAVGFILLLAACGDSESSANDRETDSDKLQVVSSFTIISDMAREIGGDEVEVHNLVPTGTDPHIYEPLPEDIKKATDADILFYNGMNLEGGKDGWFFKLMDSVGQDEENIFSLTEHVEPMFLEDEDTREEEINPHAFIDPGVGIKMAEDMRDAFIKIDPDRKDHYEKKGNEYIERLKAIEKDYAKRLSDIPEENKVLVTSECAFQYMLNRYDMKEACIWKVDTEENGSPKQIKSLIRFIEEHNVPVLFLESNVDDRPMKTVSEESGVPIYEKPIYSDEIGKPGDKVDTYIKYLNYNIDIITDGLSN